MMSISVLGYDDLKVFLADLKNQFPGRKRTLTLNQISKLLGYKSPRAYAMVMKGQRTPSRQMIHKLAEVTKMSEKERVYLELLSKKNQNNLDIDNQLFKLKNKNYSEKYLAQEVFKSVADWIHYPVYFLALKNKTAEEIQKSLRVKVSIKEIEQAIDRLKTLDLLQANGWSSTEGIPSQAIRNHHSQMMKLAERAMNEDLVSDRTLLNTTLTIPKEKLEDAKKALNDFLTDFQQKFHDDSAESIHQLSLQFFKHSKD